MEETPGAQGRPYSLSIALPITGRSHSAARTLLRSAGPSCEAPRGKNRVDMKHHTAPTHRARRLGFAIVTALGLAPATARAQFAQRLSLSGHAGVGALLTDPHAQITAIGAGGGLRPTLRIAGPLHVQAVAEVELWPTRTALQALTPAVGIIRLGGGVRLFHELSHTMGGPFVDADIAAAITTQPARLSYAFAAGWLLPFGRALQLGPVVRAGSAQPPSYDPFNFGTFWYITAGLEVALRIPPPSRPPPPPPTELVAPPPPPTVVAATPVVDPDPDHDGVLGAADRCPTEPETVNGFEESDGCPDNPDPDGDLLTGDADHCPTEAETRNNYQDDDGCPDDPDADHDGVALPADRCPEQPETRNDFEDADGCPDTLPPVQLAGTRITVNGTINFEPERDRILPDSFPLLDQVAAVLQAHPEILRIRIEGHTDAQGDARRNRKLSKKRAKAVERYLREHGVDRHRLSADGFGSERPIATGSTPEDHARNRRVEFYIVDPPGGVSATAAAATPAAAPAAPASDEGERHGHHGHGEHHRRHH